MGRESRMHGRPPKVVLSYPVGGSVTLAFHASVVRLACYECGKPDRARLLAQITHTQGLYVADNRQLTVERFLQGKADWLLQVDTDIEFPQDLIETLLTIAGRDKKVLAASVPLGAYESCAFNMIRGEIGVWRSVPVTREPQEVDGIATAVCLVHREVFEAIARKHGRTWFHHMYFPTAPEGTPLEAGRWISQGEDLAFSARVRDAGYSIWCAHVPGLKHFKTRALTHDGPEGDAGVGAMVQEG